MNRIRFVNIPSKSIVPMNTKNITLNPLSLQQDSDETGSCSPIRSDSVEFDDEATSSYCSSRNNEEEDDLDEEENIDREGRYEGLLKKRLSTSRYMGSWRFAVLRGNRLLWYLNQHHARQNYRVRGEIEVCEVLPWDGNGVIHHYAHTFAVRTSNDLIFHCCAPSEIIKEQWIAAFNLSLSSSSLKRQSELEPQHLSLVPHSSRSAVRPCSSSSSGSCISLGCSFHSSSLSRCSSCRGVFCKEHLSHKIIVFPQLKAHACCQLCYRRQDFIHYLFALGHARSFLCNRNALCCNTQIVTNILKNKMKRKLIERKVKNELNVLDIIRLLVKSRHHPLVFLLVLNEFPYYVETAFDQVKDYWFQLLHLFCLFSADIHKNALQVFYLERLVKGICKRSFWITLETIWFILSTFPLLNGHGSNILLSLLVTIRPIRQKNNEHKNTKQKNKISSIWSEVLFHNAPKHQYSKMYQEISHLEDLNDSLSKKKQISYNDSNEDNCFLTSVFFYWINASDLKKYAQGRELLLNDYKKQELQYLKDKLPEDDSISEAYTKEQQLSEINTQENQLNNELHEEEQVQEHVHLMNSLARVSENLRLLEPSSLRKHQLPLELQVVNELIENNTSCFCTYSCCCPLAKFLFSLDSETFYQVVHIPVEEGIAFSTKARAPTLVCLEVIPIQLNSNKQEQKQEYPIHNKSYKKEKKKEYTNQNLYTTSSTTTTTSSSSSFVNNNFSEALSIQRKVFGESWKKKKERIKSKSSYGNLPGWDVVSVIIKTNDDMHQEAFALQILKLCQKIFQDEHLDLWLCPYRVRCVGVKTGIIETINDAVSLDHMLKADVDLIHLFESFSLEQKVLERNYISSLAAYSLVCFVLSIKDRHNGNILIDSEGHLIHIDFGFILGIAPGGMFSVEDSPFKLTVEMIEVLGGLKSSGYNQFIELLSSGLTALRNHSKKIIDLIEITAPKSSFPCFLNRNTKDIISRLKKRLMIGINEFEAYSYAQSLVSKSYNSWGTRRYDSFQLSSNGISF